MDDTNSLHVAVLLCTENFPCHFHRKRPLSVNLRAPGRDRPQLVLHGDPHASKTRARREDPPEELTNQAMSPNGAVLTWQRHPGKAACLRLELPEHYTDLSSTTVLILLLLFAPNVTMERGEFAALPVAL